MTAQEKTLNQTTPPNATTARSGLRVAAGSLLLGGLIFLAGVSRPVVQTWAETWDDEAERIAIAQARSGQFRLGFVLMGLGFVVIGLAVGMWGRSVARLGTPQRAKLCGAAGVVVGWARTDRGGHNPPGERATQTRRASTARGRVDRAEPRGRISSVLPPKQLLTEMTTTAYKMRTTIIGPRSAFRQLARINAGRYVRHPIYLVGVALVCCGLVLAYLRPNDSAALTPDSLLTYEVYLGLAGVFVGRALAVTEDEAAALLCSTPVDRRTRTLALFAACLVPAATAAALMGAAGLVNVLAQAEPGSTSYLRPSTGAIGWVDYWASLLVRGPVAGFGGAALGLVIGRWVRFAGSAIAAATLLFFMHLSTLAAGSIIPGVGETWWVRIPVNLMPYAYWQADPDRLAPGEVAMRPGSPTGHLVCALALCGLAIAAGVLHGASPSARNTWMRVAAFFGGVAVVGYLWALLG